MKFEIVDYFCGSGGSGSGLLEAVESSGHEARGTFINHWDRAINTHALNHPGHRHFNCGVEDLDLNVVFPGNPDIKFLWASPSCVYYSRARGDKPVRDQQRASAFCVVDFVRRFRPEAGGIENVPEFRKWGRLRQKNCPKTGRRVWLYSNTYKKVPESEIPVKLKGESRKEFRQRLLVLGIEPAMCPMESSAGEIFEKWRRCLMREGYLFEYRILKTCDYGDPTIRSRFFARFVRVDSGRKVVWPEPSHFDPKKGIPKGKRRWVAVRDILQWDISGRSIYLRKKMLARNTLIRIAVGLLRYGFGNQTIPDGFVIPQQAGGVPSKSVDCPASTITTTGAEALCCAYVTDSSKAVIRFKGTSLSEAVDSPLSTITTFNSHGVAEFDVSSNVEIGSELQLKLFRAFLESVGLSDMEEVIMERAWGKRWRSKKNHRALAASAFGITSDHTGSGGGVFSVDNPALTATSKERMCRVDSRVVSGTYPYITQNYSGGGQSFPTDRPTPAVTGKLKHGLVYPEVHHDGKKFVLDVKFRMFTVKELARSQGFKEDYVFTGTKTEQVKQIGNSVPRNTARALLLAHLKQQSNIDEWHLPYISDTED